MERLRSLIKEVLTVQPKKDCNCGCGGCAKKAPIITEGRIKKAISEGLTYHVENKIPLHESVYRIGSEKHFALINEARKLWTRGLINVSEDDQAILETHLGNFGMYEGEKVPLDMPMVHEDEAAFEYNKARAGRIMKDLFGPDFKFDYTYKLEGDRIIIHPEGYNPDGTLFDMKDVHKEKIIRTFQDKMPKAQATPNNGGGITVNLKESLDEGFKDYLGYSDHSEETVDWPKKLTSRYSDEYKFELEDVTPTYQDKPGRAKYRVIDIESGELKATPTFEKLESLMAYANDLIKSQGGTQSTNLGESLEKDYIEHLQNIRNDFYNKGDKEKAAKVQADIYKLLDKSLEERIRSILKSQKLPNGDIYLGQDDKGNHKIKSKDKITLYNNEDMVLIYGKGWGHNLSEAKKKKKKKDPPIGKPKRGGSKAYYVYVRDPKTKRIKKVSFGSGGLRAKIKNAEARKRFAARHNCKNKKDRTTAGYWSCNLPRYAEQLGLGSKMNTFW